MFGIFPTDLSFSLHTRIYIFFSLYLACQQEYKKSERERERKKMNIVLLILKFCLLAILTYITNYPDIFLTLYFIYKITTKKKTAKHSIFSNKKIN